MKEKSFLQMQAYDSIKNGILNGELEPGQLYSETKLSAKIGISRTPMREALQCLSQDGYITIIPSKGFMIRQLNEKDMKDSIQIRCAIEGFCRSGSWPRRTGRSRRRCRAGTTCPRYGSRPARHRFPTR